MADESDFQYTITADLSDLSSQLEEASNAAKEAGDGIKESLEGAGEGAEEAGGKLGELTEHVNQAGEAFNSLKDPVSMLLGAAGLAGLAETIHLVSERLTEASTEIQNFAARSQMSLNESREMISSMEALGIPAQAASMAFRKLGQDVASGGEKLAKLGVETTDAEGNAKGLGEIYEEVTTKLASYGNNAKEAADANTLLGRSGQMLVATHEAQVAVMAELSNVSAALGINTQDLVEKGNVLRYTETLLNETWTAFAQAVSPLVVGGLKIIATAAIGLESDFQALIGVIKVLVEALEALAKTASQVFSAVVSQVTTMAAVIKDAATMNFASLGPDAQVAGDSIKALGSTVLGLGDNFKKVGDDWNSMYKENEARSNASSKAIEDIWNGTYEKIAAMQAKGTGQGVTGSGAPDLGKDKGGKDAADAMATQLQEVTNKTQDASTQMSKIWQEMTQDSGQKFQQFAQQAESNFNGMLAAFENFRNAVESGNKEAAKQAEIQWKEAFSQFEQSSRQAAQQYQKDQEQMKQETKQLSSEIDSELKGLTNAFMSGNKNAWSNLLKSELEKMVGYVDKYVSQMIAQWLMGNQTMQGITQNFGNIFGQIWNGMGAVFNAIGNAMKSVWNGIGSAMQSGVAELRSANQAQITSNTGTGATGAASSQASIPYVGPVLAAAAAASFVAEMASYSAAGGFDVPPGLSPLTQLHPREMVLPQQHADTIRNMAGGGGQGGGDLHVHNHMNAMDASGFPGMIDKNGGSIAKAVARHIRRGGRPFTG